MDLTQLLVILRAHPRIVLLTLFITVATAATISALLPKKYTASASVVINFEGKDPVTGLNVSAQQMPGYIPTQLNIIQSRSVALRVVESLKLTDDENVKKAFEKLANESNDIDVWMADQLLESVKAESQESIIEISIKDADPRRAAEIANAFAAAYQAVSVRLKVEPLNKTAGYFEDQIKILRDRYEEAQSRLSKSQQEKGVIKTEGSVDVEVERLNDLSNQLVLAQAASMEASARRNQVREGGGVESPDIIANPLIQNLKSSLSVAEAKFAQIAQKVERNHPQYISAKAEVEMLRSTLGQQIRATSNSVLNNASILQQREARIAAAVEAQKAKVLALNRARDEISVFNQEMEVARQAYETAMQRFTQLNLEGQSNLSDITILSPAMPPIFPSSPKVVLNLIVAIFLGSVLGIAFGFVAEMLDPRVRSEKDLVSILQAPVLGEIEWASSPHRPALPHKTP